MNTGRQERLGPARGQGSRNWWLVAASASVLLIGLIAPVRGFAQSTPGGRAQLMAERKAIGGRVTPSEEAKLTLRVYNYAGVDPEVLARTEKIPEAIFEESGIGIVWMDCSPVRGEFLPEATCPSDMGASDLVLRLLPRGMAMKVAAPKEPLGYAQQCPETEAACELTVFYFRVEELAAEEHRVEFILGHVMAHEVGHVLMGPGHSENGIMRREWSREELRRMSLGLQLGFTVGQSRKLQDAALRRMRMSMQETSTRAGSVAGQSKAGE